MHIPQCKSSHTNNIFCNINFRHREWQEYITPENSDCIELALVVFYYFINCFSIQQNK